MSRPEASRAEAKDRDGRRHGGHLAAEALASCGVDTLFTLSGGHLFPLYDGCVASGIRIVDTRHEQTAAFAAEGWAKVTRRPGVVALTAGPGVTNGMSAMTSAFLGGSPMVVLGGRAPSKRWGSGSLQELDHLPIVDSVTRRASTAFSTDAVGAEVLAAWRAAETPPRGPTFVDFPADAFFGRTELRPEHPASSEAPRSDRQPDPEALATVAKLVGESARPVLVAGAGVYWEGAWESLRRFAEEARVPVLMNGLGRGTLPADHPLAFSRARSVALREADLVLATGTPLDFRLAYGNFGEARVVHLCESPSQLARHVDLAAGVVGDLGLALLTLASTCGSVAGERQTWVDRLRGEEVSKRAAEAGGLASEASPIKPPRIYGELAKRLDRDAIVIGDGGDFVSYAGKYVDTYTPGCFIDPGPYGCLGTGPGYALAARLAHPSRQVVLLLGDGAAGFSLMDFDTLARFGAPVVAVVGNNSAWGLEKHPMKAMYGYHVAAELAPGTRYDQVVDALGGHGELVREPAELGPALDRAFASGVPSLVNVMTDPEDVYPRSSNLM